MCAKRARRESHPPKTALVAGREPGRFKASLPPFPARRLDESAEVAVIGGGVAGLVAARELAGAGLRCVVYEASAGVGGRAGSTTAHGVTWDVGAWTFSSRSRVPELSRALGLRDQMITIPATIGRPVGGILRVGSMRPPVSLIGRVMTAGDAIRILGLLPRWVVRRGTDESAASFLLGSAASETAADSSLAPLAHLYYLQELETVSRDALFATALSLSRARLHSFDSGMGLLAKGLAADLHVRLNARVEGIEAYGGRFRLAGTGSDKTHDAIIVATALPNALRLLAPFWDDASLSVAREWRYAPALVVRLVFTQPWPRVALHVLPPRGAPSLLSGLTVERAKHPGRVSVDGEAVTAYVRPDQVSGAARWEDDRLIKMVVDEIAEWLGTAGVVRDASVQRWEHAAAFTDPGHLNRVVRIREGLDRLAQQMPLYAAGDYFGFSGLDGALRSGEAAAKSLLSTVGLNRVR